MSRREHRADRGIRLDAAIDPISGYLRAYAVLTRSGVFTYKNADGSVRRELRPWDEVAHPDSIASLTLCPFTASHPGVVVTKDNAAQFARGAVSERIDAHEPYLSGSVSIWDHTAIEQVRAGKREISCGYTTDIVERPGVWMGIEYDAIQTNIRYNHVALEDRGRAGPEVRLRLDSGDIVLMGEHSPEEIKPMDPKLLAMFAGLLGARVERADSADAKPFLVVGDARLDASTPEGVEAIQLKVEARSAEIAKLAAGAADVAKLSARADAAEERLDAVTKAKAETEAKLAQEKAELAAKVGDLSQRLDAAEKRAPDAALVEKLAKERTEVVIIASRVAPELRCDGLSLAEIKREAVLAHAEASRRDALKEKLAAGGDAYVAARFDALREDVEGESRHDAAQSALNAALNAKGAPPAANQNTPPPQAKPESEAEKARAEYLAKFNKEPARA